MDDALHVHSAEFPAEWVSALRAVDPVRPITSYLHPVWYGPSQRFVLYEMVPAHATPLAVLEELRSLEKPPVRYGVMVDRIVSGLQWELYQETGRWARPCWALQGSRGGHLTSYDRMTQKACQMGGLPTEPPALGDLPPCPFDNRAVRHVAKMNRLHQVRDDIDEHMRRNTVTGLKREERERLQEFRREMVAWLTDQLEEPAEHFVRAFRTGEADNLPIRAVDWAEKDDHATAQYIEHGTLA